MTADEIEFLIVQHLDGTLSAEESARLSAVLAVDPAARAMLAEHERLAVALRAMPAVDVDADWMSAQIASRIDDDAEHHAATTFKLPRWVLFAPMMAAAALVAALTLGFYFQQDSTETIAKNPTTPVAPEVPEPSVVVASFAGPSVETSDAGAAPQMSVSVGAPANLSPQLVTALFLAEQFPQRGRVIVSPAGQPPRAFEY